MGSTGVPAHATLPKSTESQDCAMRFTITLTLSVLCSVVSVHGARLSLLEEDADMSDMAKITCEDLNIQVTPGNAKSMPTVTVQKPDTAKFLEQIFFDYKPKKGDAISDTVDFDGDEVEYSVDKINPGEELEVIVKRDEGSEATEAEEEESEPIP